MMPISLYERWLDVRDRMNNKLICFLLRHCWLDCHTCRTFVNKIPSPEIETYIDEKRNHLA